MTGIRYLLRDAVKTFAVLLICGFFYVRFLTTPVLSFLSLTEWSIIGLIFAILLGSMSRLLIHSGTVMCLLAAAALIGGAIWTEVYFAFPLSHDTAESSTWSSYIRSALCGTWRYGAAGVIAIIAGWHLANRRLFQRRGLIGGFRDREPAGRSDGAALVVVTALVLTSCSFQSGSLPNIPSDARLVPAIESDRFGYIDREGSWKIPPVFRSAELFSEGFAAVRTREGWGFVDEEGNLRIKTQFGAVGDFKSGLAPVRVGRRWGFVDTSGKWIVEPKYQTASEVHEGRARVEFWDRVCGVGNDDAPENLFQREFTEWNNIPAAHCGAENSRVGYVDTKGIEIIVPQYLDGSDFSEGRAHVADRKTGLFGYIDKSGKVALPFQYADASLFSEGVAAVVFPEDNETLTRATVINRVGRKLFPAGFGEVLTPFSEGLAPVRIDPNVGWIYIAPDGVTKIARRFRHAMPFSEGLAVVWIENPGDPAYIDTTGRVVFRVPEGDAQPLKNGIAVVKYPDNYFEYFDRTGRQILPKSRYRLPH